MMPFYSAFPPPAAAMKMIYGNFGAAALRIRTKPDFESFGVGTKKIGFGKASVLKKAVSVGAKSAKMRSVAPRVPEACRESRPPPMQFTPEISAAPAVRRDEKAPYIGITILSQ